MNILNQLLGIEEKVEQSKKAKFIPENPGAKSAGNLLKLLINSQSSGVERYYFWVTRFLEKAGAFGRSFVPPMGEIVKVKDVYSSAETSSYWGNVEQRKAAQQDRVSQYLANIGKFIKDLFQIMRELRILDERLAHYDGVAKGEKPADVALKGIWIDLVEGGGKNPSSVYGLASQVGFVILPDLFFDTFVKKSSDVASVVGAYEKRGINRKVREVLARKLEQYILWREHTERELRQRRRFVLAYLVQEYNVIKMYTAWLKPYLENVQRLQQNRDVNGYDIVTAFETSKIELEIIGIKYQYELDTYYGNKVQRDFQKVFPCVRARFTYVAIPQMSFQQEYQRGAIHAGQTEIKIDGWVCSKKDLLAYINKSNMETFDVLVAIDDSVIALRDELEKYLKEAAEMYGLKSDMRGLYSADEWKKKEEEEKKKLVKPSNSVFEPFKAVFAGVLEIGKVSLNWQSKEEKKSSAVKPVYTYELEKKSDDPKLSAREAAEEAAAAAGLAKLEADLLYDVFKKAHKMYTD
ncbi:MAG: hypothetical protein Q7R96_05315 [Nanoarchaeota archaeon]|nr:hypothetical protein [Nanoarchaeota archaeon]